LQQLFEYITYNHKDTFIVWLKAVNRYIQLKEPAFRVMEMWAQKNDLDSIATYCADRYSLPFPEALRFTKEITAGIDALLSSANGQRYPAATTPPEFPDKSPFSTRCYKIFEKNICFKFGTQESEDFFHPMFSHFEIDPKQKEADALLELSRSGDLYLLRVNGKDIKTIPASEPEEFQGAVCLEVVNLIHNKQTDDWMGVFHASAVTDGYGALLFIAPPGSGKSTIAALMLANGYTILSDDFVPVALDEPEVCSFPAAISVKSTSLAFMKELFPALPDPDNDSNDPSQIYETYMPLPETGALYSSVKAKAIIFVQYDQKVKYNLTRITNTEAMNDFLPQAWIANNPVAAERFMNWYFKLPIYSLRYSDNARVVREMKKLL
jgi:hypothetical protein